jgi:hypothetical protein
LNIKQKQAYLSAVKYSIASKGIKTIEELFSRATSMSVGANLSGIFNVRESTTSLPQVNVSATCLDDAIQKNYIWTLTANSTTVGGIINRVLLVPIDDLTKGAIIGWVLAHTLVPPIQRILKSKEDLWMRKVLGTQNNVEELAPLKTVILRSTGAEKMNFLLEYFTPIIFDAVRTALFLRLIKNIAPTETLRGSDWIISHETAGNLLANIGARISEVIVSISSDEDPVSLNVLIALFVSGTAMFAIQSLCKIHTAFQNGQVVQATKSREVDLEEDLPDEKEFESVAIPQPAT